MTLFLMHSRFMSAYEQKVEPPDRKWQYLLFAAEPYETITFKIPSREVDKSEGRFWAHWNKETKQFFLQFTFKQDGGLKMPAAPGQHKPAALHPPGVAPPSSNIPQRFPPPPGSHVPMMHHPHGPTHIIPSM